MTEEHEEQRDDLERDDLEEQDAELLPNREAMSIIEPGLTADPTIIVDPWPAE